MIHKMKEKPRGLSSNKVVYECDTDLLVTLIDSSNLTAALFCKVKIAVPYHFKTWANRMSMAANVVGDKFLIIN